METYSTTSDVKSKEGTTTAASCAGLTPNVLPDVQLPQEENSQTGVSADYAHSASGSLPTLPKKDQDVTRWHILRATYGREKQANDYFVEHNIPTFYPKLTTLKVIDDERHAIEESRIPNILFVHMSERKIKEFLREHSALSYLRFYKTVVHEGNRRISKPLTIPDRELESLRIICESESQNVLIALLPLEKFEEGQMVRVIDGNFKGVVGIVGRYQSQQRVGVVVNEVLTAMTAYVPSSFLEKI